LPLPKSLTITATLAESTEGECTKAATASSGAWAQIAPEDMQNAVKTLIMFNKYFFIPFRGEKRQVQRYNKFPKKPECLHALPEKMSNLVV